jgi:2-aminoadipate transaminase
MEEVRFAQDGIDPDLLPLEELADCAATVLAADGKRILSYGPAAGYTPLRELIGEWFRVHPGRVVITNGSLHALWLLVRLFRPGATVVAEYPVHDRAERVLLDAGAVLASVEVDRDGLVVDQLRQQLTEYLRPSFVYTVPTFHNPTGAVMSEPRRRAIVELVAEHNRIQPDKIAIVENDCYALTRFDGERLPTLFDASGRTTVYLSSFSATVAPGLRVGWMILPDDLAARAGELAGSTSITPVQLGQAAVFELIRRGSFEANLMQLRYALRLRRDSMVAGLGAYLPDALWTTPAGGIFMWIELPPGTDSRALVQKSGVRFAEPGTSFSSTANRVRLSFGAVSPAEIVAGLEALAAAREL